MKTAIAYRKDEGRTSPCMCEDLLMFSYFASKNKESTDLDLILEAKHADFDTWCGFDSEMIFYPLGGETTKAYLKANVEKFGQQTVNNFAATTNNEPFDNGIHSRAFWYL